MIPELGIKMLQDKGYEVTIGDWKTPPKKEDLLEAITKNKYDALLTLLTDQIDAEVLEAASNSGVKIISNYAVGFNNIDVKTAIAKNIVITNTPGNFMDCVAEHTVALLLGLSTRTVEGDRFMRAGKYKGWDPMILIGSDLTGKTLGLLGAGRIGQKVAEHLVKGFKMKCLYYDVKQNEAIEKELDATYTNDIEHVIKSADVVSIHVPLLPTTQHLMNKERLAMMKPTAYLINTSRGPVVDENALVEALNNGVIRGAGLDVYEFEPELAKGLAELDNVVLTPHIASARESARNEMAQLAADSIIAALEGNDIPNKVTLEMAA